MPSPSTDQQTILFLAANPKDKSRLRLDQELRNIAEGLQRAQKRDQFNLEQRSAVRPRDIQRAMLDVAPQIIHFSGHGESEQGLVFEDEIGNAQFVDGAALAGLFELFADQINCVVLNSCYSDIQAKAIAQHIPYVIGMNQAIGDKAALAFAVGFYDALGAGRPIEFAHKLGCSAIRMEGIEEYLTPVLLKQSAPREAADTDQQVRSQPSPSLESFFITGNPILQPRYFFGRQRELKRLFNLLKSHPLQNAAIIGQKRSGKTSLLNYLRTITTTPPQQLRPGQKADWLPHPQNYRWIFVDFQDSRMAQRERLLRYLLESMKFSVPEPCDLDRFMEQVSGNLHSPTIILMDEIGVGLQRCPELDDGFWESLRSLATNQTNGNLAFVLATPESPIDLARHTGHSSPFFNIFGYTTTLGPLTEPEAHELISTSPIPFSAADIDWILNSSGRWQILLQILCQERLFYLEEKDLSDDWQTEGLQRIAQFRHLLQQP